LKCNKVKLHYAKEYRSELLKLSTGWRLPYNEDNSLVLGMRNYGLIREEGGVCVISHSIYHSKILAAFCPSVGEMREIWQEIDETTLGFENFYSGNVVQMGRNLQ